MQYMGGKHRIAASLSDYLKSRQGNRFFIEPFCGALNITARMTGPRIASDASPYLITLYNALRTGWLPPENVDQDLYDNVCAKADAKSPLTAFVGYGCSYSGKFKSGLARDNNGRNYALNAKNALLKKFAKCANVLFLCCSYEKHNPNSNCLVYCDPPYANTTEYAAVGAFDSSKFWQTCREWSASGALVLVSEYKAPADFKCVWEKKTKIGLHTKGKAERIERLFEAPC